MIDAAPSNHGDRYLKAGGSPQDNGHLKAGGCQQDGNPATVRRRRASSPWRNVRLRRARRTAAMIGLALALCCVSLDAGVSPARADAIGTLCSVGGIFSGLLQKACSAISRGGSLLSAGEKLAGLGGTAARVAGLAAAAAAVAGGAKAALREAARVIGSSTSPQLTSRWFSSTYWRMAGVAALLTLPFLFAAAVQALMRCDLTLLARAALGYLPLALLLVAIATPLTMLLLAVSDRMSELLAAAGGRAGSGFLTSAGWLSAALSITHGSLFLEIVIGVLLLATALAVTLELLVREAAVYVVVLMLPLAFAALVWPARRVWAVRLLELLVALILSKFAIVAVLALAGSGIAQISGLGIGAALAGMALLALAAFSPLALMRLLPFTQLATATGGADSLREGMSQGLRALAAGEMGGAATEAWLSRIVGEPRQIARDGLRDAAPDEPEPVQAPPSGGQADEPLAGGEAPTPPRLVGGPRVLPGLPAGPPPAEPPPAEPPRPRSTPHSEPGSAGPTSTIHSAENPLALDQLLDDDAFWASEPTIDVRFCSRGEGQADGEPGLSSGGQGAGEEPPGGPEEDGRA